MPEVKCNYCGKKIWRKPYLIKKFKHSFCNRECKAKWESENLGGKNSHLYKKIEVKCKWCGEKFEIKPSRVKQGRGKFCSLDCQTKWQSENLRGKNNPFYGRQHLKETISKICLANKENGLYKRASQRMRISNPMKNPQIARNVIKKCREEGVYERYSLRMQMSNPMKVAKTRKKVARTLKKLWQNPEFARMMGKSLQKRPTKPELILGKIIHKLTPDFKYNGSCNQGITIGGRVPDWVNCNCNGKRQVIEMFGVAFHTPLIKKNISYWKTKPGTIRHYKKYGFDCLVIWDYDLKNPIEVVKKVKNFINVQNIKIGYTLNNKTLTKVR